MKVIEISYKDYIDKIDRVGCGVVEIIEHLPQCEGDKWNYIIKYEDGRSLRIFNPNTVLYEAK